MRTTDQAQRFSSLDASMRAADFCSQTPSAADAPEPPPLLLSHLPRASNHPAPPRTPSIRSGSRDKSHWRHHIIQQPRETLSLPDFAVWHKSLANFQHKHQRCTCFESLRPFLRDGNPCPRQNFGLSRNWNPNTVTLVQRDEGEKHWRSAWVECKEGKMHTLEEWCVWDLSWDGSQSEKAPKASEDRLKNKTLLVT